MAAPDGTGRGALRDAPGVSVPDPAALAIASSVLFREARLLDTNAWAAWAALYLPDAVYWVPAWIDEYRTTRDPKTEVSLIYHNARSSLEERIYRIGSRKSITALPLQRTSHMISNVEVTASSPTAIACHSNFSVHVYDPRTSKEHTRHGRYAHDLAASGGEWMIARKVITLVNDRVPAVLDFYSV
jgi:3-phenylpropionate/cinnamic acid dioxygenase small subunit